MENLHSLDPSLIPLFGNAAIFLISIISCLFTDNGFYPSEKDIASHGLALFWLLAFFCSGLSMYICWQLKVIGYQYSSVTHLAPIFYLESAIAFILDISVFKADVENIQITGACILMYVFVSDALIMFHSHKVKKERDDAQGVELDNYQNLS